MSELSPPDPPNRLAGYIQAARSRGCLVVQPRMGFAAPERMRAGLLATQAATSCSVGTITLDSYTRVGDHAAARHALATGTTLNGFPLVVHGAGVTNEVLAGVADDDFPVQVRHGTAVADDIVGVLVETGIDATEGGPVSYTLPYGRTPLEQAVASWRRSCIALAEQEQRGVTWHVETFGGCMLGQLCPPDLLVALSLLEALFFRQCGVRSVSLSYAQQTNPDQDLEALAALRQLAAEHLQGLDWHVVLYTWMGLFPETPLGARRLLEESARLAVRAGVERLIVKTAAEAHRLPTIEENVTALQIAAATAAAAAARDRPAAAAPVDGVLESATELVEEVLADRDDVGEALLSGFRSGRLDLPYCLHPDNRARARSYVEASGRVRWADAGEMPLSGDSVRRRAGETTAQDLLNMLRFNRDRFDVLAVESAGT